MSDLLLHIVFKELDYNPMQTSNAMNHQVFWYANLKVWSEHIEMAVAISRQVFPEPSEFLYRRLKRVQDAISLIE